MAKIDIIFLGTGDAFNTDGLANQSILIQTKSIQILVDAGPTSLYQMMKFGLKPEELDYIFITHFHGDHTAGIPFLLLYLQKKAGCIHLPAIIGPEGIQNKCVDLCEAAYAGVKLNKNILFKEIKSQLAKSIRIHNDFSFDVHPITHKPESIGYRFYLENKIIAVSGDTRLDEKLIRFVDSADAAIIECTNEKPDRHSHTSIEELSRYVSILNAKLIIPVHSTKKIIKAITEWNEKRIKCISDGVKVSI